MTARALCILFMFTAVTGCTSQPLGKHRPSLESVELLRQSVFVPLAVGDFVGAQAADREMNEFVTVRTNKRSGPNGGSLASYLRASLVTELEAVGKYDPVATTVITGELLDSRLDGGSRGTNGTAALAARILVTRSGRLVYDNVLREQNSWNSSYLGEVAIVDAFNQYTELYSKLIVHLFQDEAFKAAVAP